MCVTLRKQTKYYKIIKKIRKLYIVIVIHHRDFVDSDLLAYGIRLGSS